MTYKIGIVGLGVMGHNLALNMERNGFPVAGYDLDAARTKAFLGGSAAGKNILGVDSPASLMAVLEKPRRILLMVPAGAAVDNAIAHLKPHLEPGDILMDGGNSFFMDTERRNKGLEAEGFNFIGTGVSGGEEGALWGPAIMPGGQPEAWEATAPIFRAIAAKSEDGQPCVDYMGPRGAGHYVQMVHNGIEYGDMQLIAEIYDLLHRGAGIPNSELADIFSNWNEGILQSYLIEITANILGRLDEESGEALVEFILDEAAQKGTGKWTSQTALDVDAPLPTINAAVESRILSSLKTERIAASRILKGYTLPFTGDCDRLIGLAQKALYASKITSYAQGFGLLKLASKDYSYNLNYAGIARIWRAGCINRAGLLNEIASVFERNLELANLLLDYAFCDIILDHQAAWREILQTGIGLGIPMLATSASLAYFDAYRSERLPANLTQAQRDYFGAHTYRRTDREGIFHTEWIKSRYGLNIKPEGAMDLVSLGALNHRVDSGIIPFSKAVEWQVHPSGGEYNVAANLSNCFRLRTGLVSAMVEYPIGDLISERVRQMGITPFYKYFKHNGVNGPNMATIYSDRGYGLRAPVVFYNRANEAAAQLKPGDFDWSAIFANGVRWFHSGGIFASLSETTGELILEAMQAAKAAGLVTSFDLNYRAKLWNIWGGLERAQTVIRRIVENVDVLVGNEEDLQLGLGIPGPEVVTKSKLDPTMFFGMIDNVVEKFPNVKIVATTLREVHSTIHHGWGAVAWIDGKVYISPTCDLDIHDRVGGGDGFAAGFFYGLLTGEPEQEAVDLGWAHGALITTFPGDTTMASVEQVRSFAKGGSARIQR